MDGIYRTQHQNMLSATDRDLTTKAQVRRKARLQACAADKSGRWLTVPLSADDNLLSSEDFIIASRLRLGLPLAASNVPQVCRLCDQTAAFPEAPDHFAGCGNAAAKPSQTKRHNKVLYTLKSIAERYHPTTIEPAADHFGDTDTRGDIMVHHTAGTFMSDVNIVHPLCPSYVALAARHPEAVRTKFEGKKISKHMPLARRQAADFHPFVCETLGAFGSECEAFFKLIYRFAADREPANPVAGVTAKSAAVAAVAVALQRAVADSVRGALLAARPRPAEWHRQLLADQWRAQANAAVRR